MAIMLLTAQGAAERLGIKVETLYAYVSRGRLRSVAVEGSRERHYRIEDIDAFRGARGGTRAPREGETAALTPIIDSAICLIEDGRLYYRGQDAIRLSDRATLEDVARVLGGEAAGRASSNAPRRRGSRRREGEGGTRHRRVRAVAPRLV